MQRWQLSNTTLCNEILLVRTVLTELKQELRAKPSYSIPLKYSARQIFGPYFSVKKACTVKKEIACH